jgi:hypothetical protein
MAEFFFLIYMGCPGQLARTTTIPHGPLNILQAQGQVRHRGGDRRAHRGSNPGRGRNKSHDWPQQLDPQVRDGWILIPLVEDKDSASTGDSVHSRLLLVFTMECVWTLCLPSVAIVRVGVLKNTETSYVHEFQRG